ncbi:MAG TPA: (2Fe-2S)-binding protein [Candidatus Polarisedimenticolia bacterium]|nr:(2Fe-2S)-binding protein [Candidatus Polarisedimenticolia bacterium]
MSEGLHAIRPPEQRVEREMVRLRVNGAEHTVAVRPYDVLLDVLRERLLLTGTRRGCDMGTCGCCTVHLDGRPVLSCLTLALEAEGRDITTIEGIAAGEEAGALHPVQEAFVQAGGSQCGFCTPGFIMTAVSLLERNPDPTEEEVREAISGNMCRCTGYIAIVEAIRMAGRELRARRAGPSAAAQGRP